MDFASRADAACREIELPFSVLVGDQGGMQGCRIAAAGDLIGFVEGPGDLSTNPKYMEGFGT